MYPILAIETSCDDTCASLIDEEGNILSNIISGQKEIHNKYQGIVPELASRRHSEVINVILKEALERAGYAFEDAGSVAVTYGPGLVGSLLTGIAAAKSVSSRFNLELIPVNHIDAHIYSIEIEHDIAYPYISLVVSGGHTALFEVKSKNEFNVLGFTKDDAGGEAYDKVAKMLDLGYPGGPEIESLAAKGTPRLDFPRPTLDGSKRWSWNLEDYDFSFSGLKTAVYYHIRDNPEENHKDIAASFQRTINDVLVYKTIHAARSRDIDRVAVAGGVAANGALRETFQSQASENGIDVYFPSIELCTDNAAMIGYRARHIDERAGMELNAAPRLSRFSHKTAASEKIIE